MIETEITILINRKSDIDLIKEKIFDKKVQFPIYFLEYESYFKVTFSSDYEEWELDKAILESLPDYEFTSSLEKGRKEIRLQISRYQSELSTDGWGRRIEDPLNETKYLIRKSKSQVEKFNPNVKVFFESDERDYYINIINGVDKKSGNEGFLLLNEFKLNERNSETEFFRDRLYSTPEEAFQYGFYKMRDLVNQDFKQFAEIKKKEKRKREQLPRKIIRDFIKASNTHDIQGLLKNLHEKIRFEKRVNWRTEFEIKGKDELKEHFESPEQEFCGRDLKIRSSWNFEGARITIGIKYYPPRKEDDQAMINTLEHRRIKFEIQDNSILRIVEEK
jgi:hypothetical protein